MPVSQAYNEVSGSVLPEALRVRLQEQLQLKLAADITFAQAGAVRGWLIALGLCAKTDGLDAMREIREAIEGKSIARTVVIGPSGQPEESEAQLERLKKIPRQVEFRLVTQSASTVNGPSDKSKSDMNASPAAGLVRDSGESREPENSRTPPNGDPKSGASD
jgi:hypothetical protein